MAILHLVVATLNSQYKDYIFKLRLEMFLEYFLCTVHLINLRSTYSFFLDSPKDIVAGFFSL